MVRRPRMPHIGRIPDIDPRRLRASQRAAYDRAAMDQPGPAPPAVLLEREHEVERVRAALGAARRRAGGTLVIEGAAGIGKSRLLEAARSWAPDLGVRVFAARATELEHGFPFGIVRQLFERPLLEADAGERERWLAGAAALAADVLTTAPRAPPAGSSGSDPGYAWQHGSRSA